MKPCGRNTIIVDNLLNGTILRLFLIWASVAKRGNPWTTPRNLAVRVICVIDRKGLLFPDVA